MLSIRNDKVIRCGSTAKLQLLKGIKTMMNGSKSPFGDFDFGKMFDMSKFDITKQIGEFNLIAIDMEGVIAAQRKNIDALAKANHLTVESMQAIGRRQSEIFRAMMEEATSAVREVMAASSVEEKAAKQTEIIKDAFQQAVVDLRELADLVAKSQSSAIEVVQQRVAESLDEVKTVIGGKNKAKGD